MKILVKTSALAMIIAVLLAAGCGKKSAAPLDESAGKTSISAETTLPAAEGVEDWDDSPSQQTGNQQTGGEQTGTQEQTGGEQTGSEQTGSEQTGNQQTGSEQTGNQQTGSEQTGTQEQPSQSDVLTLEEYNAMSPAQRQEYFKTFADPAAFHAWLEAAEKDYAERQQSNTVTGNGTLDLGDYMDK